MSIQPVDEDEEGDSVAEGFVDEDDAKEGLDFQNDETITWLKRVGLHEFAQLPWALW